MPVIVSGLMIEKLALERITYMSILRFIMLIVSKRLTCIILWLICKFFEILEFVDPFHLL